MSEVDKFIELGTFIVCCMGIVFLACIPVAIYNVLKLKENVKHKVLYDYCDVKGRNR
jgi:hypothetical protein